MVGTQVSEKQLEICVDMASLTKVGIHGLLTFAVSAVPQIHRHLALGSRNTPRHNN
jgi:hypothetical protein